MRFAIAGCIFAVVLFAALDASQSFAHEGHDHGPQAA